MGVINVHKPSPAGKGDRNAHATNKCGASKAVDEERVIPRIKNH